MAEAAKRVVPIAMVVLVAFEWNGIWGQPLRDSLAYHEAAADARGGRPLYDPLPAPGPHSFEAQWPYLYPPPLAALLAVFPSASYRVFDRIWLLLNMTAYWVFAASLGRMNRGRWSLDGTLTWGAGLFFLPGSLLAIHFGNAEPIVWALVGAAFAVPTAAGVLLCFAASLKLTPAWPLAVLAARRPGAILVQSVVGAALLLVLCVAVFGVEPLVSETATWWRGVLPTPAQGQFWGGSLAVLRQGLGPREILGNLSPSFAPIQLAVLAGWSYEGGVLPTGVRLYLTGVALVTPLFVLWRTRGMAPREQAAFVFVAAALAAPIVRPYVLPIILLPWALRSRRRGADGAP